MFSQYVRVQLLKHLSAENTQPLICYLKKNKGKKKTKAKKREKRSMKHFPIT